MSFETRHLTLLTTFVSSPELDLKTLTLKNTIQIENFKLDGFVCTWRLLNQVTPLNRNEGSFFLNLVLKYRWESNRGVTGWNVCFGQQIFSLCETVLGQLGPCSGKNINARIWLFGLCHFVAERIWSKERRISQLVNLKTVISGLTFSMPFFSTELF